MNNQEQKDKIVCIKGKDAPFVCQNEQCENNAFVCINDQCQCQKQHIGCVKAVCKSLIDALTKNISSLKTIEDKIQTFTQKIIGQLSKFRDKALLELKQNFRFFGLSDVQKLFMTSLKNGDVKSINGVHTWEILVNLKTQEQVVKMKASVQKDMDSIIMSFERQEKVFQTKIFKQLKSFDRKYEELFSESKVLKSPDDSRRMDMFFSQKKIKSATILYRASQNNFQAAKFHSKCDNNPNTITLVETQFGKVIGGYTPLPWTSAGGQQVPDESGSSFMFSSTNGEKFPINNKLQAIYRHSGMGPCFGSTTDLCLVNSSHTAACSGNINLNYYNDNYNYNNKQSWTRFSGAQTNYQFKTKQWQVWKIEFEQPIKA